MSRVIETLVVVILVVVIQKLENTILSSSCHPPLTAKQLKL